ncbi:Zinc finger MYM-type protein 1 [Holothuria leucospilota]|uniref:Zinc finger MYM-type protein 1 n=1 Tax=Holothuria leucospilota TaxID=206669 RepID=A0A9Q1BX32_HOLLE|nr:Zinc finger MYM-type protein 1 [Holothuria leucospilota]
MKNTPRTLYDNIKAASTCEASIIGTGSSSLLPPQPTPDRDKPQEPRLQKDTQTRNVQIPQQPQSSQEAHSEEATQTQQKQQTRLQEESLRPPPSQEAGQATPPQPTTQNEQPFVSDRPLQPFDFDFPKRQFGQQCRSFQSSWFKEFPWLSYDQSCDRVTCFICAKQNKASSLQVARNKEQTFITEGFYNWKKALLRFREHQNSNCHRIAFEQEVTIPATCRNVLDMCFEATKMKMEGRRQYLIKIIECLQFLGRQGIPIQGNTEDQSNFIQLLRLRARDNPFISKWVNSESETVRPKKEEKYTSHDIQNEIFEIMAHNVIRDIVQDIRTQSGFYSFISD